jgi:predicted anti-sigma-YlaC factor YlaD
MNTSCNVATQADGLTASFASLARARLGAALALLLCVAVPACSVRKLAVNKVGDALSEGGDVYASDDDPELVEAAAPFSLKLMESLLAESPRHRGLLTALASGFTLYAYPFVHLEADRLAENDLDAATAGWDRAKRLYVRARDYGLRGLELGHAGFVSELHREPERAVEAAGREDVPLLYWTALSWAGAVTLSKDDPDLVGDLPIVEALIDRALELDETFRDGAIHEFMIAYEMSRPAGDGDPAARARTHFERSMELSGGGLASPLVSLATYVCVAEQDRTEFEELLERALAIDPDDRPEWRLANIIYQRQARWLLDRTDRLFLE